MSLYPKCFLRVCSNCVPNFMLVSSKAQNYHNISQICWTIWNASNKSLFPHTCMQFYTQTLSRCHLCLSIYLSINQSIYLPTYPSIHPSTNLCLPAFMSTIFLRTHLTTFFSPKCMHAPRMFPSLSQR